MTLVGLESCFIIGGCGPGLLYLHAHYDGCIYHDCLGLDEYEHVSTRVLLLLLILLGHDGDTLR